MRMTPRKFNALMVVHADINSPRETEETGEQSEEQYIDMVKW